MVEMRGCRVRLHVLLRARPSPLHVPRLSYHSLALYPILAYTLRSSPPRFPL